MPNLYQVRERGLKSRCGPVAAASIVGCLVRDVEDHVNRLRGRPAGTSVLAGTYWHEILHFLKSRGYLVNRIKLPKRPPSRHSRIWVQDLPSILGYSHVHLVETTDHFVALRDGLIVDTFTPTGRRVSLHPYRRKHVTAVWVVHPPKRAKK